MGAGLAGGPLTGGPASQVIAPSTAIVASSLGAGATDVVVEVGSTAADGTVNAAAKLLSIGTGIGGTYVEKLSVNKAGQVTMGGFTTSASSTMTSGATLTMTGGGSSTGNVITLGNNSADRGVISNAIGAATASATIPAFDIVQTNGALDAADLILRVRDNTTVNVMSLAANGVFSLMGTDSSGSPGAAAIEKGSGKSAIAVGASSVVITNAACATTSCVIITPQSRDTTCKELIAVPGAGSFTVSGSANATAALIFSWQLHNIL